MICFINKHLKKARLEISAFKNPFGSCYTTVMAVERERRPGWSGDAGRRSCWDGSAQEQQRLDSTFTSLLLSSLRVIGVSWTSTRFLTEPVKDLWQQVVTQLLLCPLPGCICRGRPPPAADTSPPTSPLASYTRRQRAVCFYSRSDF